MPFSTVVAVNPSDLHHGCDECCCSVGRYATYYSNREYVLKLCEWRTHTIPMLTLV